MEIEAKFSIPDEQAFQALQSVSRLGTFDLSPPHSQKVHDIYFDSADRHIWKAGYAFRRRQQPNGTLITLKALRSGEGVVKRREETEVLIPREGETDTGALNALRQRVQALSAGARLEPLFHLEQTRIKRYVIEGEREIAELSIDEVELEDEAKQRRETFRVLEVELLPEGTEDALETLIARCQRRWDLPPDPRTKLERAQAFYEVEMPPLPWLVTEHETEDAPKQETNTTSVETLLARYDVDVDHAEHVAEHALRLFDALAPIHQLAPERRELLQTAARVHDVGRTADRKRRHRAGQDILLESPPEALDAEARRMVAATTYLHRKRFKQKKLDKLRQQPYFAALSPRAQEEALALAALLRMAVGLESSRTGTTQIKDIDRQQHRIGVKVTGPEAAKDAARAEKRSDLWRYCFDSPIIFEPPQVSAMDLLSQLLDMPEEATTAEFTLPVAPHLEPDDTMAEAARKTFLFHFQRMLYHEAGTRQGEDIEALHDMRVATRRMRNAARLFEDYLAPEMKPFIKGIKHTNRALGAVRDLDVFWQKTEKYLSREDEVADLAQLETAWAEAHSAAREALLAYLNSKKYRRFKQRFGQYLQSPWPEVNPQFTDKGEAIPRRLRHIAPILIYQRLSRLRAYEGLLPGETLDLEHYHRLRIAAKYFRYTLEYFEEILGPEAETLITKVKELQDHLGDLQDAVVASNILRDFLLWGTWEDLEQRPPAWPSQLIVAPDVVAYLQQRQKEVQHALETFPDVWMWFQSQAFRRLVADTVAVL